MEDEILEENSQKTSKVESLSREKIEEQLSDELVDRVMQEILKIK